MTTKNQKKAAQATWIKWTWQECDGQLMTIKARKAETAEDALLRHFKQHEQWRKEMGSKSKLRDFIPEVTPGTLRLYVDDELAWSSEAADLQFGPVDGGEKRPLDSRTEELCKSLREALDAATYHAAPLKAKKLPRAEWRLDAEKLLKQVAQSSGRKF